MKVLPINTETNLRTYTYYSYLDAIVHNEYRTGSTRALLRILDYEKYEWNFPESKLQMELKDGICSFTRKDSSVSLNAILFRELMEDDIVELEILYQQYSQPWGSVFIFISEDKEPEVSSYFPYQIGNFCKTGCFVKDGRGNQINTDRKLLSGDRILLKKEGDKLIFACRVGETGAIDKFHEITLDKKPASISWSIGIGVFLYNNVYYEWLYANHIQWRYHKQYREIPFEFESSVERNWKYYTLNYFVTYKTETLKMIRNLKVDVKEYIRASIREENYIELRMDSFYLSETVKYQERHFMHVCLIYGYNDEKRLFYVLCVNQGKPFLSTMTYDDFEQQALQYNDATLLVSQKYDPECVPYELHLAHCIHGLRCYLDGKTVLDTQLFIPRGECSYGIDVYDVLMQERELQNLMTEKRMGYLIYEHKQCMYNRLRYLVERGLVDEEKMQPFIQQMEEIKLCARTISDFIVMYRMSKKERLISKVKEGLQQLKEMESNLYPKLIGFLMTEEGEFQAGGE